MLLKWYDTILFTFTVKTNYSWPFNNMGLSCTAPLLCRYFSVNICWPFVSMGFTPADSTNHRMKTVVLICYWESVGVEGRLYTLSYTIYRRDLGVHRFWYLQGSWNQSSTDIKDPLIFGVWSYVQTFDSAKGLVRLIPMLFNYTELFFISDHYFLTNSYSMFWEHTVLIALPHLIFIMTLSCNHF